MYTFLLSFVLNLNTQSNTFRFILIKLHFILSFSGPGATMEEDVPFSPPAWSPCTNVYAVKLFVRCRGVGALNNWSCFNFHIYLNGSMFTVIEKDIHIIPSSDLIGF